MHKIIIIFTCLTLIYGCASSGDNNKTKLGHNITNEQPKIVCKFGQKTCGNRCYNPGNEQCLNGVVCNFAENLCNGKCYNPAYEECK